MKTAHPTSNRLLASFHALYLLIEETPDPIRLRPTEAPNLLQTKILELLEISPTIQQVRLIKPKSLDSV